MKKWFITLAACLCNCAFAAPIQDHRIEPAALTELAIALKIPEDADLIEETQKHWLRKPGQERWEMAELPLDQKLFVLDWAKRNGLFDAWKPTCKSYDKALILGATTSRMQMRLDYLKRVWEEGTRFEEIVWLTGDRPLDPRIDGLIDRCLNESEAARILWEETDLPPEMKQLPVRFVAVPMKKEGDVVKRPTTADTVDAWLEIAKEPCKVVFVSDQPFCGYQFAIIKADMPDEYPFDLIGQEGNPTGHPSAAAIILDAVARWIYAESQ